MNKSETLKEINIISAIGKRAKELYDPLGLKRDLISWTLDIDTVHNNIGLDLERLLNADDGNFGHDLGGIAQHLNRTTGKLEDCFVPRYAV